MSNETKQTAVEWLLNEWPILNSELPQWLIEQAKEMEKEQIEDAYSLSRCEWNETISSSQYYNETYGGGKE
jgi:hypothetical protein